MVSLVLTGSRRADDIGRVGSGPLLGDRSEPDPFLDTFTGLVAARAVTTAVMLGVFDALDEGPATAPELAERLSLDRLGTQTLLTAL